MNDEIRLRIEMQTQENIDGCMKPEEACYAALQAFGWEKSIKETCEQQGFTRLENLVQDNPYGTRTLRKNPGFTVVAVVMWNAESCRTQPSTAGQYRVTRTHDPRNSF